MKKYFLLGFIVIAIVLYFIFGGWTISDKINITSPAYIYSLDGRTSEKINVELMGDFNHKDNGFRGSMKIGNINYSTVLFVPGLNLNSYNGKEKTILGRIFYDNKSHQYSVLLNKELSDSLNIQYDPKNTLIISSPATNYDQAKQIHQNLNK